MLLNLGEAYPNQLLTVVLRGGGKKMFGSELHGVDLGVVVKLIESKGKP